MRRDALVVVGFVASSQLKDEYVEQVMNTTEGIAQSVKRAKAYTSDSNRLE